MWRLDPWARRIHCRVSLAHALTTYCNRPVQYEYLTSDRSFQSRKWYGYGTQDHKYQSLAAVMIPKFRSRLMATMAVSCFSLQLSNTSRHAKQTGSNDAAIATQHELAAMIASCTQLLLTPISPSSPQSDFFHFMNDGSD